MRKNGKGNIFTDGMMSDSDPSLQPNKTYRYAKNIRLISHDGENIGIQPYDSDRLALELSGFSSGSSGEALVVNWGNLNLLDYTDYTQTSTSYPWKPIRTWASTNGVFNVSAETNGTIDNYQFGDWQNLVLPGQQWPNENMNSFNGNGGNNYVAALDIEQSFWNLGAFGNNLFISTGLGDIVNPVLTININTNDDEGTYFYSASITPELLSSFQENAGQVSAWLVSQLNDQSYINFTNSSGVVSEVANPFQVEANQSGTDDDGNLQNSWIFYNIVENSNFVTTWNAVLNADVVVVQSVGGASVETVGGTAWFQRFLQYFSSVCPVPLNTLQLFIDPWIWNQITETYGNVIPVNQDAMDFWVSQEAGNIPYEPWGNQFVPEYDANQVYNFSMIFAAVYEIALFWDTAVMMWAQQSGDILIDPFEISLDSVELFSGQAEFFEIEPETADSMAGYEEGEIIPNGMQILGSYEFSDYLVLLGKWNGLTEQLGYPVDFVLKVHQNEDGTLSNPGEEGYQLFYQGNLGFSDKMKLKVVGSEENEVTRRIYFTDGEIPLRTMNVAAQPWVYNWTDDPNRFNLFVQAEFTIPVVTGFSEGGSLDSVAYSYCYRYKTKDGKYSRISPASNPASVPVSPKNDEASFTHGAGPGTNTNKIINGVLENLDGRYKFVEMIYIPYINGAPGTAMVFNTYEIPSVGQASVQWTHTGNEEVREEIIVGEFGTDNVSWDTCKAMEVKDNRLFCGNLIGMSTEVPDNFRVQSYNSKNEPHGPGQNPDLFRPLLYSTTGVHFNGETATVIDSQSNELGKYCMPNDNDYHRYIKGPSNNSGNTGDAFYPTIFTSPQYFSSDGGPLEDWEANRGIFGAESPNFNTALENGEFEGVRVTFRMLDRTPESPALPVQLDRDDKLISTGTFEGASAPFYRLDANPDTSNFYANYSNPIYNSNYVGYRRGEIYRFGILFYDKKGQPMFVKQVGDIRMPEHSTEYIKPQYTGEGITSGASKWPFYYQTSRSSVDGGFANWPNPNTNNYEKPYSSDESSEAPNQGHYAGVLYPYFEVKLSSDTASKVGGYSIVRVPRDTVNRTIITSGVLQRAVKYADSNNDILMFEGTGWRGSSRCDMDGRYGDDPLPLFTATQQGYDSVRYGQPNSDADVGWGGIALSPYAFSGYTDGDQPPINLDDWFHASNVYTIDSPEVSTSSDFGFEAGSGMGLKIVEQRYSFKQNIKNTNRQNPVQEESGDFDGGDSWYVLMNKFLSDGDYNSSSSSVFFPEGQNDYEKRHWSLNLFATYIAQGPLEGQDTSFIDPESDDNSFAEIGGWKRYWAGAYTDSCNWGGEEFELVSSLYGGVYDEGRFDSEDGNSFGDDEVRLGLYAKYYSKRIPSYPMYGMARPDWAQRGDASNAYECGTGMDIKGFPCDGYPGFLSNNGYGSDFDNVENNTSGIYPEGVRACNVLPDILLSNEFGDGGEVTKNFSGNNQVNDYWFPSNVQFAKIVNPNEEVDKGVLSSDRPYKNATMWTDFTRHGSGFLVGQNALNNSGGDSDYWKKGLGGNIQTIGEDDLENNPTTNSWCENNSDYAHGNRKIVLSLKHQGAMPITRHCLQKDNYKERVKINFQHPNAVNMFGLGDVINDRWNQFSPEITVASLTKNLSSETLYGGTNDNAFSKNVFQSVGHFTAVNQNTTTNGGLFLATGTNGHHVFGGDTYVCNFSLKKTHNPNPDGADDYLDRAVLTGYTCPIESEVNLDLRHGNYFSSSSDDIPRLFEDDYGTLTYNTSYSSKNSILSFLSKPIDFLEVFSWPSTVAYSEPKFPGDFIDSYSMFPANQIKDLDYGKGPITQMFLLQNDLFALQNSGTCKLSVNPRVMVPSGDQGTPISVVTGAANVIERFDYVSESYGSQHFHGLAVTDIGAYYYDDNASKFLKLGRGKGGGFGVVSLGDAKGVQSHFYSKNNITIGDRPLTNTSINLPASQRYFQDRIDWHSGYGAASDNIVGGISIGYDSQYSEILLTTFPDGRTTNILPETIVYNEAIDAFTGFVSKRGADYINFKNRMYTLYDNPIDDGLSKLYLSNGFDSFTPEEMMNQPQAAFLNFGEVDYYIFDYDQDMIDLNIVGGIPIINNAIYGGLTPNEVDIELFNLSSSPETFASGLVNNSFEEQARRYKEPIQLQVVFNDETHLNKTFDKMQIMLNPETNVGSRYLYFRKFAYKGSSNILGVHEWDMMEQSTLRYANIQEPDGFHSGIRGWYNVKDGSHYVPMRRMRRANGDDVARGTYTYASMVMGWNENNIWGHSPTTDWNESPDFNIKNERFSIFSIIPYYRISRI